jgi:micrococcal nuclease
MPSRRAKRPHTVAQLIRRRRRMWWSAVSLLCLLGATSLLDHRGAFKYRGDDWANFDHQECVVTAVADGDTLTLRQAGGGAETKVRLLGIDAPERHDKGTGKPAYWSDRASAYLKARANGKSLIVRLEPTQTRDKYGRLLAYVFVGDNENLNLSIVRDGQAYADRRFRHTMRSQFEQAENEARTKGRGLWKEVTEAQMPQWRQRWLKENREAKARR